MIFEKHLVLLVHVLHFLCARCDDDKLASRWKIFTSLEPNYDSGSAENYVCCDSTSVASLTSEDPRSTESLDSSTIHKHLTTIIHESTIKDGRSTTDFWGDSGVDETSSSLTVDHITDEAANITVPDVDETSSSSLTTDYTTQITKTTVLDVGETSSSFLTTDHTTQTTKITVSDDEISATTMDSTCDSSWPINATENTKEVINLKKNESTEWISLSWESPCTVTTNATIRYSVERCDSEKNCNETEEHNTWHNATNLDACTQYTFTVKIITDFWVSPHGVVLQASTDSAISEIGEVRSLNVSAVDVNTVQLTWLPPEKHAKCISNYSIAQCIEQSCNETAVRANMNYTANDLEPCTLYKFSIKTVTLTVKSGSVNISATTASPIPSEPQSMQIIPSNFSLTVLWEPPQSGLTCLKHYEVTIMPKNSTLEVSPAETNITIDNLYSCILYSVSVYAVNEDGQNGSAITRSETTTRTKTNSPHAGDSVTKSNSISILVNLQDENNRCPLISLITICNHTTSNGTGYELLTGISIENITSKDPESSPVITVTVSDLSPFTEYSCKSYVVNIAGSSNLSNEIIAQTKQNVPSAPLFRVTNIMESQFSLTWNQPEILPGIIEDYEIALVWTPLYPVPVWCPPDVSNSEQITRLNNSQSYNYRNAKAYRQYNITMKAKTEAGWGNYSELQTIQSKAAISDPPTRFACSIRENPDNINVLDTIITWGIPCNLNGDLEYFNVSIYGTRDKFEDHIFSIKDKCDNYDNNEYMCSVNVSELMKAEYNYTFSVYPKTLQINMLGPATGESGIQYPAGSKHQFLNNSLITFHPSLGSLQKNISDNFDFKRTNTNFGQLCKSTETSHMYACVYKNIQGSSLSVVPPQPDMQYVKSITIDPLKAIKSTTTATVLLPLFFDFNGDIKYYAIMVSEHGYSKAISRRFNLPKCKWPTVPSWKEAKRKDFGIMYQATQMAWDPYPDFVANYGSIKAVKFEIGAEVLCDYISPNESARSYCNGPLKPDTWYDVRMRAFTNGGYADSEVFVIKTNAELNVAFVIGIVFGILCLGILTTMMLLVRKCSPYVIIRRFLNPDMPGSPVPAPFTRKKFISHCQQLVDNPGKLSNEFRLLQTLSVDLQMPTNAACLQANRKKNRYSDILPYDFSRVKLDVIDNDPNTDYINASFIRGYTGEDEYIACQGPKEETTYDFWRMVDQYNINIIVMLTQLVEKGKEKCHQYYPTIRETFRYENMTIRCTSELDFRTYTQRTLVLQKENKKRSVMQLHFKDWPDHDVPEDFDPMINFCQIMRRNIIASKGFVVVHCSAGIGRTGTLIAIDILLQHLRDNRKLDVFGTVYRLRHHRINMVQRESQYAYIYNCIKQVLKNPYFLKTYKPPPVEPVYENTSKKAKDTENMDANLVNSLEILKRYNSSVSMESLETIHNFFPWSCTEHQRSTINNGLRQYKSMDAIDVKSRHSIIGKVRTLENVISKSLNLKKSTHKLSSQSLTQESYPLITYSNTADLLGNSSQCATDNM